MIDSESLYAELSPRSQDDYLKVLSGYDRGFLKSFLSTMRAIFTGNLGQQRRNKKDGMPYFDYFRSEWINPETGQRLDPEKAVRQEIKTLQREIVALTRKYMRITAVDSKGRQIVPSQFVNRWQREVGKKIVYGNIRAYAIGHGDKPDFKNIQSHIKSELNFLSGFASDVENGELKKYGITDRIAMYADSILLAFSQGDVDHHVKDGDNWEGWRRLDPHAAHCPDCPAYATDGYVEPSEIMPIGCCSVCMRRCKCTIVWRRKRDAYYKDLVGLNTNLMTQMEIAQANFQYYKRMGLNTKDQARRYVMLKRSIGHQAALEQVKKEIPLMSR